MPTSAARPPTSLDQPRYVRVAHAVLLFGFGFQLLLGHLVAFGLDRPVFAWHQHRVALALWGTQAYAAEVSAYRGWIQAVFGGTMISYAWAMLFVAAVPLRRREPWAAWAIAIATLNWFVIDTAVSASHGVWINVGFNLVALSSIAVPLVFMIPWLRDRPGRGLRGA